MRSTHTYIALESKRCPIIASIRFAACQKHWYEQHYFYLTNKLHGVNGRKLKIGLIVSDWQTNITIKGRAMFKTKRQVHVHVEITCTPTSAAASLLSVVNEVRLVLTTLIERVGISFAAFLQSYLWMYVCSYAYTGYMYILSSEPQHTRTCTYLFTRIFCSVTIHKNSPCMQINCEWLLNSGPWLLNSGTWLLNSGPWLQPIRPEPCTSGPHAHHTSKLCARTMYGPVKISWHSR